MLPVRLGIISFHLILSRIYNVKIHLVDFNLMSWYPIWEINSASALCTENTVYLSLQNDTNLLLCRFQKSLSVNKQFKYILVAILQAQNLWEDRLLRERLTWLSTKTLLDIQHRLFLVFFPRKAVISELIIFVILWWFCMKRGEKSSGHHCTKPNISIF